MCLVNVTTYKGWYNQRRKRIWEMCNARGSKTDIHNAAMLLSMWHQCGGLSKAQSRRYTKLRMCRNSFTFDAGATYGWRG